MIFMTVKQVAETLECSRINIQKHIENGNIEAVKPGKEWLIHRLEVERFKRENRKPGRPLKNGG